MVWLFTHPLLPSASCSLSTSLHVALFLSRHVWGRRGENDRKLNTLAPLVVCISRGRGGGGCGVGGKEVWTMTSSNVKGLF